MPGPVLCFIYINTFKLSNVPVRYVPLLFSKDGEMEAQMGHSQKVAKPSQDPNTSCLDLEAVHFFVIPKK